MYCIGFITIILTMHGIALMIMKQGVLGSVSVGFVQPGHKVLKSSKMCIFRKWQQELHNPLLFHCQGPACEQAVIRER